MGGHVVEVLKVSSKSNPNSVAGALAGVLRQTGAVEVQVVGAGALNQAIKAIAIARGFVAPSNLDLVCIPTFADILIDGQSRTAIRLAVEDRSRRKPEAVAGVHAHAPAPAVDVVSATPAPVSPPAPTITPPPPRPSSPSATVTLTGGAGNTGAAGPAVDPDAIAVAVPAVDVHAPPSSEPVLT
ncbi:MAG: stage sporulation protein [Actinomycetota bacterium]|nr:stage sporulation protein [Actinomycetota bacterium]